MISLAIWVVPPYTNDKLFDPIGPLNRDDCLAGFHALKSCLEVRGGQCHTLDVFQDKKVTPDAVLFLDIPTIPLEFILGEWSSTVKKIVILQECPVIISRNWDYNRHESFDKIFTWSDDIIDGDRYIKMNFANKFPQSINFDLGKKEKFCTLIAGNKNSSHPLELYSKRVQAIRWFENNHPEKFDLYGVGWEKEKFPSYCGKVINKKETLEKYKFAICYENAQMVPGYITEKIFDCFFAGCVPVYWGANNVTQHIPCECFIDWRDFADYEELYQYLLTMTDEKYKFYLKNIQEYLNSPKSKSFTHEHFAAVLADQIELSCSAANSVEARKRRVSRDKNLDIHYAYQMAMKLRIESDYENALQTILKAYDLGKKMSVNFENYMFVYTEMALIYIIREEFTKVVSICQEAITIRDSYIDIHFLMAQALFNLGDKQGTIKSCLRYLEMVDNFCEMEKDGYVMEHFLGQKDDILRTLVILFLETGEEEKALGIIGRIKVTEYVQELLPKLIDLYVKFKKHEELNQYYKERILIENKQLKKLFEEKLMLAEKVYEKQEEENNSITDNDLVNHLVASLEALIQAEQYENALNLIKEFESFGGSDIRILTIKSIIFRKKYVEGY